MKNNKDMISDFLPVSKFLKWKNFVPKNREEYIAINQIAYNAKQVTQIPTTVHIEPTNYCNQKCRMCCHPQMTRKKQHISDAIAYKAIDECANIGVYGVHFFFFGEPFMNKKTIEYMGYAKKKGIPVVSTTSNFTIITDQELRKLVDYEIDSVHISFEGIDRQRYKTIRGTDDYTIVIKNIKKLLKYRKDASKKIWIALTYVRTTETQEEINEFINDWRLLVDDLHISPQFDYLGKPEIRQEQDGINSSGILERDPETRLPCRQLWLRLVVLSNGDLVPCSQNIDGELSVGNIADSSIKDAWNGDKMQELRAKHLCSKYLGLVCADCIDWDWSGKIDTRPSKND